MNSRAIWDWQLLSALVTSSTTASTEENCKVWSCVGEGVLVDVNFNETTTTVNSISMSMDMELGEQIELAGWNSSLSLVSETTTTVNSIPLAFTIANLPIVAATIAANTWAIFVINRKETSRINRLDIFPLTFLLLLSIFLF